MVLMRPVLAAAGVAAPLLTIAALVAGGPLWIPLALVAWGGLVSYAVTVPAARTFVIGWAAALVAFVFGLFAHYAIAIDHALCGGAAGSTAVAATAAIAAYLAASVWALRTGRRAAWAWPTIVLLGWGVHLALLVALPGAHGFCET